MSLSSHGLSPALVDAATELGYTRWYPIQEKIIPLFLDKKDVLGIAPTGSGKTAAYVLPVLELLRKMPKPKNRHIPVLVLVPTRELAVQVNEVIQNFSAFLPEKIKSMAVFGGVSINPQMINLQNTLILVATPGRLLDLVDHNALDLSEVKVLILDEADKMLSLGFEEEIKTIFNRLPVIRQNALFSATLAQEVSEIQNLILKNPVRVEVKSEEDFDLDVITQQAYYIQEERKGPLLRYLIKNEEMSKVLVFTSSVHRADQVCLKLNANNITAMALHSKKSQGARTDALTKFKAGKIQVLVATDLASRGIDILSLPFVINYELPRSPKDYIHRIGRTGRAESPGTAISLISPDEEHHFKVIKKKMKKEVEMINAEDLDLR